MSQTASLPGDGENLPELKSDGALAPKDRTKSGATRKRDDRPADKKPNIFQRIALFVRQTIAEMKKVTYPTKEELWTYFLVVIVFVALMMLFTGFRRILSRLVKSGPALGNTVVEDAL